VSARAGKLQLIAEKTGFKRDLKILDLKHLGCPAEPASS
jgi:hypothetical protein